MFSLDWCVTFSIILPEEMVVAPKDGRKECARIDVTMDDHPLSINPESKWQTFFKDNEVLLQIDKDVRYTFIIIIFYVELVFSSNSLHTFI